jgi:methyltransferase FkbM-like protein
LRINTATRFLEEYIALIRILEPRDLLALVKATATAGPEVLRTQKLTALDAAMSRNMTIHLGKTRMMLPLVEMDRILAARKDNPTFGNVREVYVRDCYLEHLRLKMPVRTVLDLGANRGIFSLLALLALKAEIVVGVELHEIYESVYRLLLEANGCSPRRGPRYRKYISSPSAEQQDPMKNISIETILSEQKIERFRLVKIDIEGHEKTVFSEPEWLAHVDNITMEMHPHFAGDLSLIPETLERYGFKYRIFDQPGNPAKFLFASCTGELAA